MVDIPDIPQRSTLHGGYPSAMDQIHGGSWGPSSGPDTVARQVPRVLSQSSECLRWNAALATRTFASGLEIQGSLW